MFELGRRHRLPVSRDSVHGLYLDAGEWGEVLLPGRQPEEGPGEGDEVDVFLYRDSEDRLVATMATPRVMAGEFAALHVVSVHRQIGAFLDWGLPKDLLLPFREQSEPLYAGDTVVVHVSVDPKSDRIVASTRLKKFLSREEPVYAPGAKVSALVFKKTPLGYSAIVDGQHLGLLFHSTMSGHLEIGQTVTAYVHEVRPEGKIDLRLDQAGYQRVAGLQEQILAALRENGGKLALSDGSSPEEIRDAFAVSKKAFKQALGALFKQRLIRFEKPGVVLAEKD